MGKHLPEESSLIFPGDCGMFSFKYYLESNKLLLENALGSKFIAEKKNNCNKIDDYKTKLKIDYLKIQNKRDLYKPTSSIINEFICEYINIDYSKKNNLIRIEYFNKINTIDKIDSILEYIENTHSDVEIPFINYVLTPDKNLKISNLKLVINKLNKNSKKKIFIRTLKIKPERGNLFEYLKINNIDLKSEKTLEEIIN